MQRRSITKKPAKRRHRSAKLRPKAKPLRAEASHVRSSRTLPVAPPLSLLLTEQMGRVMAAYAELPARLLGARSPVEFWTEYFRFWNALIE